MLALITYFITHTVSYPFLAAAIAILAIISFIDDIKSLGTGIRLVFQFIGIGLVLYQLNLFQLSFWYLIPIFIFCLGMLNIFNFMDGINGITGFYSLVTLGSALYINQTSTIMDSDLLIYSLIGVAVFGFFNFRKKAIFFAGDIGSITIGVFLLFLLMYLSIHLNTFIPFLLISLYFIDGGITILERLFRKENIFKPHKSHLYQVLTQKTKLTHLQVAALYALIQLCVNGIAIFLIANDSLYRNLYSLILIIIISLMYYIIKRQIRKS